MPGHIIHSDGYVEFNLYANGLTYSSNIDYKYQIYDYFYNENHSNSGSIVEHDDGEGNVYIIIYYENKKFVIKVEFDKNDIKNVKFDEDKKFVIIEYNNDTKEKKHLYDFDE